MSIREHINELLSELGERDLARQVARKLNRNEEAGEAFRVCTEEGICHVRELRWSVHPGGGIIADLE